MASFNLYRADRLEGPFTKVNAKLIFASPDPITGGKYKYEDANAEAGRTYYHRLDDVELRGTTTPHGPIKITASASTPEALVVLAGGGLLIAGGLIVAVPLRRRRKGVGEQAVR